MVAVEEDCSLGPACEHEEARRGIEGTDETKGHKRVATGGVNLGSVALMSGEGEAQGRGKEMGLAERTSSPTEPKEASQSSSAVRPKDKAEKVGDEDVVGSTVPVCEPVRRSGPAPCKTRLTRIGRLRTGRGEGWGDRSDQKKALAESLSSSMWAFSVPTDEGKPVEVDEA